MAKLWITQFSATVVPGGTIPSGTQIGQLGGATQALTFTTSTQSSAISAATRFVRVVADADCHIAVGDNPTATTGDLKLTAGSAEYFGVTPGHKIAVIAAA